MKYYSISGTDNNSEFYYMNDAILEHCPNCGLITNRAQAIQKRIATFKIKKKNYNLSTCSDGPAIASEKFVEIVNKHNLKGLSFIALPASPGFYLIRYEKVVGYDYAYNPHIYLKEKCKVCQQWYEISKVFPIKVVDKDEQKMDADTFYRTDLEYGEKVRRQPLVLVTENIPLIFKNEKVKDVYFEVAGRDFVIGNPKANEFK